MSKNFKFTVSFFTLFILICFFLIGVHVIAEEMVDKVQRTRYVFDNETGTWVQETKEKPEAEKVVERIEKEEKPTIETRKKAKQEVAREKRAKKINNYLSKAEKYLSDNKFSSARSYAKRAFRIDKENEDAVQLLANINRAEVEWKAGKEARKKAKREAKKKAKEQKRLSREEARKKVKQEVSEKKAIKEEVKKRPQVVVPKKEKKTERYVYDKAKGKFVSEEELTVSPALEKKVLEEEAKVTRIKVETSPAPKKRYVYDEKIKKWIEVEEKVEEVTIAEHETKAAKEKRIKEEKRLAKEKARREAAEKKRVRRIGAYLNKAKAYLGENKFTKARNYVKKALSLDSANEEVPQILADIDETETKWKAEEEAREKAKKEAAEKKRAEKERKKKEAAAKREAEREAKRKAKEEKRFAREEEARRRAEQKAAGKKLTGEEKLTAREQARRESRMKKIGKKIGKLLEKAKKYFSKRKYNNARRYAFKAQDLDPTSTEAASMITEIDKSEMFETREKEEAKIVGRLEKTFKESEKDVSTEYEEGHNYVVDLINGNLDFLKGREYKIGRIQEGRVYTIDECVQLALNRSRRYKVATEQIKLAEMRVWESRRDLLPQVTGKIERSTGKIGVGGRPRHYHGEKYQLEVEHTLFDGMEKWFGLREAQVNRTVVKLEGQKIENEIVEDVKKAYYNFDKSIKALDIQGTYKKTTNSYYDITQKAYDREVVPETEYLKVKSQNMQQDFQYISAAEDVKLAEMILFQALNMEPDQHIKIKPVEGPKDKVSIGLENCYKLALANRPGLRIKAKMIEYYNYERKMAKARGWPRVYFQGSFGESFEAYQPLDTPGDYTGNPAMSGRGLSPEWYAGIRGSVPIWGNTFEYNYVREKWAPTVSAFRGTETATSYLSIKFLDDLAFFSNLQEAKVGFERAKYEYEKEEQDVIVEVKELYFKYRKSLLQMDLAEAQLEHQKGYVNILDTRSRLGEGEISRILEEVVKLAEYEFGVVQADADYYISLAELNQAVGISDYFKPDYENEEYKEWKKNIIAQQETLEKTKEEKLAEKQLKKEAKKKAKEEARLAREKAREEAKAKRRTEKEARKKAKLKAVEEKQAKKEASKKVEQEVAKEKSAEKKVEKEAKKWRWFWQKPKEEKASISEEQKPVKKVVTDTRTTEKMMKYLIKARSFLSKKSFGQARNYVQKALNLDPGNEKALGLLSEIDAQEQEEKQ